MENKKKKISLIGSGGMARESLAWLRYSDYHVDTLYNSLIADDIQIYGYGAECFISSKFKKDDFHIIAVGYPDTKVQIINSIKEDIKWNSAICHSSCMIGNNVIIEAGSIVSPLVSFTSNVSVGRLATINTMVTIGHDCIIGEMFHASPGAVISGNVIIGDRVFMGANSCIKEKKMICNDVIIGMGAVVVKDITEPGVYLGNPARMI